MQRNRVSQGFDQFVAACFDESIHRLAHGRIIHGLADLVLQLVHGPRGPEGEMKSEPLGGGSLVVGHTDMSENLQSLDPNLIVHGLGICQKPLRRRAECASPTSTAIQRDKRSFKLVLQEAENHDRPVNSSVAADSSTPRNFATTRWSLILTSADLSADDRRAHQALAELCRLYWRPIFSFVCWRGHSTEDAQDLTQDFFLMMLEGNWLKHADPNRGRFRSLLLKSLQNFLNDAAAKKHARKRGGAVHFVSWHDWMAEAPSQLVVSPQAIETWPAERLFDLRWAATVVEQALRRLREECESQGRLRAFEALRPCLGAEREDVSYPTLSQTLGVPEATVKRLVHRLRQRYRTLLRDEVAETVADPAEVDDEIRHLCAVLAATE